MSTSNRPSSGPPNPQPAPRMLVWALITVALVVVAMGVQSLAPGSVLAVTAYKAHLMALGGWGGYWLDRALFPYDRPHQYLDDANATIDGASPTAVSALPANPPLGPDLSYGQVSELQMSVTTFGHSMLRRAIVVAACLLCVGLGA